MREQSSTYKVRAVIQIKKLKSCACSLQKQYQMLKVQRTKLLRPFLRL